MLHIHLVNNGIIQKTTSNSNSHIHINNCSHSLLHSQSQHHSTSLTASPNNFIQLEQQKLQQKYKLLLYRPMVTWFVRFFSGIIHQSFLIRYFFIFIIIKYLCNINLIFLILFFLIIYLYRVFDKLIGCLIHGPRPFYILISIGKALITHSREQLLLLSTNDDITNRLLTVSDSIDYLITVYYLIVFIYFL